MTYGETPSKLSSKTFNGVTSLRTSHEGEKGCSSNFQIFHILLFMMKPCSVAIKYALDNSFFLVKFFGITI